jgi:DNA (cytosine-5)-methyltransferase 1
MTLGLAEAAYRMGRGIVVPLAVDNDKEAAAVFRANFPQAQVRCEDVSRLFDGPLAGKASRGEARLRGEVGAVDILVAGPPCQGHSDLNNHTRRKDLRNNLYERVGRAAVILSPRIVIIENVPAVVHDADRVVDSTAAALANAGYTVEGRVVNVGDFGVAQTRRRHLLVASRSDSDASDLWAAIRGRTAAHTRSVRWAIGDLESGPGQGAFDSASKPSEASAARLKWLFENDAFDLPNSERPRCHRDNDHSYNSMYGRLTWDKPAQTVTTGFGSMGQGRYVHPAQPRTLTPHEAARLQGFPDFFDFDAATTRGALARLIGNAVPPIVMTEVGLAVIQFLSYQTSVTDAASAA